MARLPDCDCMLNWCQNKPGCRLFPGSLTPNADLPACRDEDPAHQAVLAAAYPDPPEYPHPEETQDGI